MPVRREAAAIPPDPMPCQPDLSKADGQARSALAEIAGHCGVRLFHRSVGKRGRRSLVFGRKLRNLVRMDHEPRRPRLRIRIHFGEAEMMGPGKAELLERIERTGSLAAAGREMGMSYKRAWELTGTLNAMFRAPVVISTRGGPGGGGAVLTDTGREVLRLYRSFEREAARAGARELEAFCDLLHDISDEK